LLIGVVLQGKAHKGDVELTHHFFGRPDLGDKMAVHGGSQGALLSQTRDVCHHPLMALLPVDGLCFINEASSQLNSSPNILSN
jgi:hypothetical protein